MCSTCEYCMHTVQHIHTYTIRAFHNYVERDYVNLHSDQVHLSLTLTLQRNYTIIANKYTSTAYNNCTHVDEHPQQSRAHYESALV